MPTTTTQQDDLTLARPAAAPRQPAPQPGQQLPLAQPAPPAGPPGAEYGMRSSGSSPAPELSIAQAPGQNSNVPAPTVQAPSQPVDRVALATQAYDTFAKAQEPAYQKSLESVTGQAAGLGQLGSGQWRTALRDEANRHQLNLDTARDSLINKATEGSIADASTAFQQALAGSQQGLAERLGTGQLEIARENANTSKTGTLGQLDLARAGQEQSGQQFNQSLEFQKAQADIDAQFRAGTMTIAQRDQALRELQNSQQYGLAGQQLELARTGQAADIANQAGQLELARAGQEQSGQQFDQSLEFQRQQAAIDAQFRAGTLTIAQRDQALRELANSQAYGTSQQQLELARGSLAEQTAARLQQGAQFNQSLAQSGEQFRASLAQNAEQFGLSQAQQSELARLSDATANRSINASTEQGRNSLLIELARILGGPTGTLNPAVLAEIARGFGVVVPGPNDPPPVNPGSGSPAGGNTPTGFGATGGTGSGPHDTV